MIDNFVCRFLKGFLSAKIIDNISRLPLRNIHIKLRWECFPILWNLANDIECSNLRWDCAHFLKDMECGPPSTSHISGHIYLKMEWNSITQGNMISFEIGFVRELYNCYFRVYKCTPNWLFKNHTFQFLFQSKFYSFILVRVHFLAIEKWVMIFKTDIVKRITE